MQRRRVGIFVFEDVEVLDFAAPFEVFSRARLVPGLASRRSDESAPFEVFTVGRTPAPVRATGGLTVVPQYSFADAPGIDLLLVPGGFGSRALLEDREVLDWIASASSRAERTLSVCTGALLLAKAGLLRGRRATTHWGAYDLLASLDPTLTVERGLRFVEDDVLTSAGVSAGLDLSLRVVELLCGAEVADETARYIEYRRRPPGD